MEEKEYSPAEARAYILDLFTKQGDFLEIVTADELGALVDEVMALDEAFMEKNGCNEGEVYDDDDAFDAMFEEMGKRHEPIKMYMMRLVEDYMDYNEQYLDSIGAIEWD